MSERPNSEQPTLQPRHVAMLLVVAITLAACFLLLSAARSIELVDGAIAWHEESPLRAVVQTLCLGYRFPTIHAGDVKVYLFGVGAACALLVTIISMAVRGRTDDTAASSRDTICADVPGEPSAMPALIRQGQVVHRAPLIVAQALLLLLVLWSLASSRWSATADVAIGGSVLLAIGVLWALALGNGLSPSAGRIAGRIVVAVSTLTALVAIAYYYGRNPNLRAKFPFGNPTFLSAALIPGILLTLARVRVDLGRWVRTRTAGSLAGMAAALAGLTAQLWAFRLADSRGAMVGLGAGLLTIWFWAVAGRRRIAPVVVAVTVAVAGGWYFANAPGDASHGGRGATARLRAYAWSYAWRLFEEHPITGAGQGGYSVRGDAFVVDDVLSDPVVFDARLSHAHNEWLEVLADLGVVGFGLVVTSLVLTSRVGALRLVGASGAAERWTLLALMGALVGLTVEEAFGVGLRVSTIAPIFYTVIGLIWSQAGGDGIGTVRAFSASGWRRAVAALVGAPLALALIGVVHRDWTAALNAHRAEAALRRGENDDAVRFASLSTARLRAPRALANRFRLVEAHLHAAREWQGRALDRERRADRDDASGARRIAIAMQDCERSDAHCQEGSRALKDLVARSPGYINSGRLEFDLNLTRARNIDALARLRGRLSPVVPGDGDAGVAGVEATEDRDRSIQNAARAIEREMRRQPFNPEVALDYLRVDAATLSFDQIMAALARPLRHNRLGPAYVGFLSELAADQRFDRAIAQVVVDAQRAIAEADPDAGVAAPVESWAPERLRLVAGHWFTRGDYGGARRVLELAADGYARRAGDAPFGAACCQAELADCRFYERPDQPGESIQAAEQAIRMSPSSWVGRAFRLHVRRRLIEYELAAGLEPDAMRLLRDSAPSGTTDADAGRELGVRYRRLCESILARRDRSGRRRSIDDLLPALRGWIDRSLELNGGDYLAHRVAADLAFHTGDDAATAAHVLRAIQLGLPVAEAARFLSVAREQRAFGEELAELWANLVREAESAAKEAVEPPSMAIPPGDAPRIDAPEAAPPPVEPPSEVHPKD